MKYRFPEEFVNRVREANDLAEIASEYMTLKKSGDRYLGLCPFHRRIRHLLTFRPISSFTTVSVAVPAEM